MGAQVVPTRPPATTYVPIMNRFASAVLGFVLASTLASQGVQSKGSGSQALIQRQVTVLDLKGSPRERGRQHGKQLKAEIRYMIQAFKKDLARVYRVEADTFIRRFLADTDFMPAIEKWTPGLLDEVRGIAEGSGQSFADIYVFQLADEIWSMGKWSMKHKCTAIAVNRRGDQPTMVAQNMDVPGFYQKYPTLLRIHRKDGPDTLVLSCPGLIGVNGMNSAAVAVCCNTLLQLAPSGKGVPCLFVVRGVLERASLAAARDWLQRIPHAVGQNYTLGDPKGAQAFECSAKTKVEFRPDPEADFTYHTNHPLVNTNWHPDYLARCHAKKRKPEQGLRTCHRFAALQRRIRIEAPITLDTIQTALASRDNPRGPICGDWTYGCTIFVLTDKPTLRMSPGRPDRVAFQDFGF